MPEATGTPTGVEFDPRREPPESHDRDEAEYGEYDEYPAWEEEDWPRRWRDG